MTKKKLYITTAIPYANGAPHIGNALDYLIADIWSRYQRQQGNEVRFQVGTDEHGNKLNNGGPGIPDKKEEETGAPVPKEPNAEPVLRRPPNRVEKNEIPSPKASQMEPTKSVERNL